MIEWAVIGIPVIRSVGGWITKATADGKITKFEIKKLIKTVLNTSIVGFMLYFGLNGVGVDVNVIGSASSAIILDMILKAFRENKNVTKR